MADLVYPGQTSQALNDDVMPASVDLYIYKGDYVDITVTLKDDSGVAINLNGYTAAAVLKENYAGPVIQSFTCSITNAAAGTVRIYMPTSTSTLLTGTSYIWDFQIVNSNNDARTYFTGDVTVYPQITP